MSDSPLFFLIIAALFFSTNCVRDVELIEDSDPMVVVDCVLTDSANQSLRLFYTAEASSQERVMIDDADVRLYDLTTEELVGSFVREPVSNDWTLNYLPTTGHVYRLEIDIPGEEKIWAEQAIPTNRLSELSVMHSSTLIPEKYAASLVRYVYLLRGSVSDACWIYGLNYNEETGKREIAEEIYTDYEGVDNFNLTGDSYSSTSDEQFGAQALLDGSAIHRRYLRIPPQEHNETFFVLSGSFSGEYYADQKALDDNMGVVEAMFVSDEYDIFLREVMLLSEQRQSSNLADIFIRNNIYSNIHGGIGFFGAKSVRPVRWHKDNYIEITY